jgi:hypothetical protein
VQSLADLLSSFSHQGTQFPNTNANLVYIASSTSNILTVVETQADGSLVKVSVRLAGSVDDMLNLR